MDRPDHLPAAPPPPGQPALVRNLTEADARAFVLRCSQGCAVGAGTAFLRRLHADLLRWASLVQEELAERALREWAAEQATAGRFPRNTDGAPT